MVNECNGSLSIIGYYVTDNDLHTDKVPSVLAPRYCFPSSVTLLSTFVLQICFCVLLHVMLILPFCHTYFESKYCMLRQV